MSEVHLYTANSKGRTARVQAEMCSGSEAGSYFRLIDFCVTQLLA